jgi:hypothetical protein
MATIINASAGVLLGIVAIMEFRRNLGAEKRLRDIAMRSCASEAQGIVGRSTLVQLNTPQVEGTIQVRSHLRPLAEKVRESVDAMLDLINSLPSDAAVAVHNLHKELRALERLLEQWTQDESAWPLNQMFSGHGLKRVDQIRDAAARVVELCDPEPRSGPVEAVKIPADSSQAAD